MQNVELGELPVHLDPLDLVGHVGDLHAAQLHELLTDLELDLLERLLALRQAR